MAKRQSEKSGNKEPVFIVKSALKHGGLDYLHISLIALVIILIALAFSLAYFKPAEIIKNCQYGIMNGTCISPQYNSSQVLAAAGKVLANYANVNSSLALLPYYSEPNNANVSYLPATGQWLVDIPYIDPFAQNKTFYVSMMFSGKNLSLIKSYLQSINPGQSGNNTVVSLGTVQIGGRVFCQDTEPFPVYMITDPYAPGAFAGIAKADNLSKEYPGKLNVSYDFIFTNYSSSFYSGYGVQQTQLLGEYLYCAANQRMITPYSANITKIFDGRPLSNVTLYETAIGSGLNATMLNACMANSTSTLDYQAKLAGFYGIVQTPQLVVNCRYSSIPETVGYAINYTISKLNNAK
ncbi:hypothetical protein M1397_02405 [Candidatus Marsarchaeota archaeon]|nr:hypothetical protein [Candidatus Marsarchaeota archaeon]